MNEINTALYSNLSGDATLTALLYDATSIYHLKAKEGATLPYIVFNVMSETEPNDTRHRILDIVYQVRGFTTASAQAAEAIDARIQTLLHGAALSVSSHTLLKINRIGGIQDAFSEQNTDTVYSVGSFYRVRVEKTA